MSETALVVLENGMVFKGKSFGAPADSLGEVCFNTSMTGYQEILTDPSYSGQIITMTYPMIGNYGIHESYNQSSKIQAEGFIVKKYCKIPSNYMSQKSLADFLKEENKPGIEGIDTRKLVLTIREEGAMRGGIFTGREYDESMLEQVRAQPSMAGQDLVSRVTASEKYSFGNHEGKKYKIAVIDYGVKTNILRNLDKAGFAVDVFPAKVSEEALSGYDCYFLSNGPGDPEPLDYAIKTAGQLVESGKPLFGICLGHQILGQARGWKTYKLKFGHRGGNQPVQDMKTGRVEITAQNHGFAVEESDEPGLAISYINLNDRTIEGFTDAHKPIFSVQHHPEAAPGPNDSLHMFKDFYELVQAYYAGR